MTSKLVAVRRFGRVARWVLAGTLMLLWTSAGGGLAAADDDKGTSRVTAQATNHTDITSSGPLTNIAVGVDGSVQISHSGDSSFEYYPPSTTPGDAGTLLAVGSMLFAPAFGNHGGTATGGLGATTAFTPVSQSAVSGSGTSADPFKVTTVYDAAGTGLRITETDAYVVGQEAYRTDIQISNLGASTQQAILYRAGDCFLGSSDFGFGVIDTTTNAVACAKNANNSPPGRIEQILPITGGNQYMEDAYSTIWSQIGTKGVLPNTCQCSSNIDNGIAVSWSVSIPAGGSVTRSHLTTFSPVGTLPLTTVKTADNASSQAGGQNGYTITVGNPNAVVVTVSSVIDTLPAGFSYVNGSTTGFTNQNPNISGQTLTWPGGPVPAGGSLQLHFGVVVSQTPGTYLNNATAVAPGFTVGPTGDTAPVTVQGGVVGGKGFTLTTKGSPLGVLLTWQPGTTQDGYFLFRITLDGAQPTVITLPAMATSYSDTNVNRGVGICYLLIPKSGNNGLAVSDFLCGFPNGSPLASDAAPGSGPANLQQLLDGAARLR